MLKKLASSSNFSKLIHQFIALSIVCQQWGTLTVLADNITTANVDASSIREGNNDGSNKEDGHDCECKNPLESNDGGEELGDSKSGSQDREAESQRPVLEGYEVETSVHKPSPNEDVCYNSSCKVVRVHSRSTDPIQGNKSPRQWSSKDSSVHELGALGVTEVGEGQVEPVENDEQQGPPKVGAAPKVDEAESKQVIENECMGELGCRSDELGGRVEVIEVGDLDNVEHDPVDASNNGIQGEWSMVGSVLSPDGVSVVFAFTRGSEVVVDGGDDNKEVGGQCQDSP